MNGTSSQPPKTPAQVLRDQISGLVADYHAEAFAPRQFIPGQSAIPVSGKVFDEEELQLLVQASLDFWLTTGRFAAEFERELAKAFHLRSAILVNSGSSANLLAVTALTSPLLGDQRLKPGDEVITVAAGFPTTLNPIIQNGLLPVFIDATIPTYNADSSLLEAAFSDKTRAIIFAHTLGNPFDLQTVSAFAKAHDLWLIEDCCDALGATYNGRHVGTFGDLATVSFYPAHHITMGEGGAVLTNTPLLKTIVESFRDWGRDCWCPSGQDNTCGKRFDWQLGELPDGYDHKYIYSHLGYNLKPLDIQAAIGRVQMKRLPEFINARKQNWEYLRRGLANLEEFFDFSLPTHATSWSLSGFTWDESGCQTDCSWFGFLLLVKPTAPFTNRLLARHLDHLKIGNRMLFGGNLLKQPVMVQLKQESPDKIKIAGEMMGADILMNQGLFLGTYPGLTQPMLDYEIEQIQQFVKSL